MITVAFKRLDGSMVGEVNGLPYQFIEGDRYWTEAQELAADIPSQKPVVRDGVTICHLPEYFDGVLVTDEAGIPLRMLPKEQSAPDAVSARQFKLHLLAAGLYQTVETWVAAQPLPVRVAYDNSSTFRRDDKTLEAGFAAMGVNAAQVDAFFIAASKI